MWFFWGVVLCCCVVPGGDLGPAEEYVARIDVEVDSPGPSHVIRSVPLQARVGTARVHAPKDLQVALVLVLVSHAILICDVGAGIYIYIQTAVFSNLENIVCKVD